MDAPTTVIVHFHAKPGKADALRQFILPAIPHLSELHGCRGGSVFNDLDDPELFVLVEHWDSREAHRAYVEKIESDGTMDDMMPLLAGPPERRYLGSP